MDRVSELCQDIANETFSVLFHEPDHRIRGWFLMNSMSSVLCIAVLYLVFVFLGPRIMRNRQPLSLKKPMIVYNFIMALTSAYMAYELFCGAYHLKYSYMCQPMTFVPGEMRIVKALYIFYVTKLVEFLDTVFIVLRKKEKQLSFLHVYHHSSVFVFSRIGFALAPSGSAFQAGLVNSLVHFVMYSYYGLSALGSERINKYLKWKNYITKLQLLQFGYAFINAVYYFSTDCNFPVVHYYLFTPYIVTMIALFSQFHRNTYSSKKKQS